MNLHAQVAIYRPASLEFQAPTPLPNVILTTCETGRMSRRGLPSWGSAIRGIALPALHRRFETGG